MACAMDRPESGSATSFTGIQKIWRIIVRSILRSKLWFECRIRCTFVLRYIPFCRPRLDDRHNYPKARNLSSYIAECKISRWPLEIPNWRIAEP